ncbi:MAG: hypothetical protein KY468_04380, partial [Armatimonadetes bacterium]|nr:hypothetical protein [Armatimonadota bacterium]
RSSDLFKKPKWGAGLKPASVSLKTSQNFGRVGDKGSAVVGAGRLRALVARDFNRWDPAQKQKSP